jgi:hypothetical protein
MTSRAPRVATWLLLRFSSGPHGEAIAGDLMEQYAARGSRMWYWRQVLSAIRADLVTTISANKTRTAAAVAMGLAAYFAASYPLTWGIRRSSRTVVRWIVENDLLSYEWYFWIVLVDRTLLVAMVCVTIGWVVSALSRRSAPAAVCILAITILIFEYGMMAFLFSTRPIPQISTAELVAPALFTLSRPVGILAGGLLAMRPNLHRPSTAA